MDEIARCPSCDGYGWEEDDDGAAIDCEWCAGVGYVYREANGVVRRIPPADWEAVGPVLEALEQARLREIGYTGEARKPWEQAARKRDEE